MTPIQALEELADRCDGDEGVRADGSNIQTIAARACLSRYGQDVQARAHELPPLPDTLAMLRTCEPTPALVYLLASSATAWARAGRVDDACAALSLALCARSAIRNELTTGGGDGSQ